MSGARKVAIALVLIGAALLERLVFDLGPNVELVTTVSLLAAVYLGAPFCFFVPLAVVALSDTIIGNTSIFIFTWSAYLAIGGAGLVLKRFGSRGARLAFASAFQSLVSSFFFYLWTNFGVWLQGWYPPTLAGLGQSYIRGLPFLKLNLLGNLVLVPVAFFVVETAKMLGEKITMAESKVEA